MDSSILTRLLGVMIWNYSRNSIESNPEQRDGCTQKFYKSAPTHNRLLERAPGNFIERRDKK